MRNKATHTLEIKGRREARRSKKSAARIKSHRILPLQKNIKALIEK